MSGRGAGAEREGKENHTVVKSPVTSSTEVSKPAQAGAGTGRANLNRIRGWSLGHDVELGSFMPETDLKTLNYLR